MDINLVFGNVVLRYGFNSGITVSEEVSRWLFLCTTFLALFLAFSKRRHEITLLAGAASGLNRYPDREFSELRAALAAYLSRDTVQGVRPEQVWAANGSNEVMLQLLQAFGGPGRTALSFAPTYSMYPEYARNTHTRWVEGLRRDDFSIDVDAAMALIGQERPDVVFLASGEIEDLNP